MAKRAFLGVPVPAGPTVHFWVWKKKELCDLSPHPVFCVYTGAQGAADRHPPTEFSGGAL